MKRWTVWAAAAAVTVLGSACAGEKSSAGSPAMAAEGGALSSAAAPYRDGGETMNEGETIYLMVDGKRIPIRLGEGKTAQRLSRMLPADLSFEDFNSTEKIAYLPEKLDTAGDEGGHAPRPGDLCLYRPWGNLCIFYKPWSVSGDLIYMGHVEEGLDTLIRKNRFTGHLSR